MFNIIRIITLVILWICVGVNWYLIIRNILNLRRWRKENLERLRQMEEWFDSARQNYLKQLDELVSLEIEELEKIKEGDKNYENN